MGPQGFYDMHCPKCDSHIGWLGNALDNPGCDSCGWQPDKEQLREDAERLEELKKVWTTDAHFDSGPALRRARKAAGLSIGQAADVTGIPVGTLSDIERGKRTPKPEVATKINDAYGIGKGAK